MPAMPAYTDALSYFPAGNSRADGIDHAGDFVSWNARVRDARPRTFLGVFIAVADAAGLHFDAHRTRNRFRNFAFHQLKRPLGVQDLNGAHLGHDSSGVM